MCEFTEYFYSVRNFGKYVKLFDLCHFSKNFSVPNRKNTYHRDRQLLYHFLLIYVSYLSPSVSQLHA